MDINRQESIKRITESIWEKEESLKNDIDKERQYTDASLRVIKECVEKEFPIFDEQLKNEVKEREDQDNQIESDLEEKL